MNILRDLIPKPKEHYCYKVDVELSNGMSAVLRVTPETLKDTERMSKYAALMIKALKQKIELDL